LPDRQVPALGNEKVKLRKAIDLSKLNIKKLKELFGKLKRGDRKNKKIISHWVGLRRTQHKMYYMAAKRKRRNRRRNQIAKESRRRNKIH